MTEPDAGARFTGLYAAHYVQVYAYVVSRAGRQFADDVVSETFLVTWRRFAEIPAAPLPWLLGVARNVLRERCRDEERQSLLAVEMRTWIDEASVDVAEGVTERAAVLAALARLAESDRELLTLVAWQGLSNRAAARVVGCSMATFSVRLHRARKRLAQAMERATREIARRVPPTSEVKEFSR